MRNHARLTSGDGASRKLLSCFFRAEEGLFLLFFCKIYIPLVSRIFKNLEMYFEKNSSKSPSSAPKKTGRQLEAGAVTIIVNITFQSFAI